MRPGGAMKIDRMNAPCSPRAGTCCRFVLAQLNRPDLAPLILRLQCSLPVAGLILSSSGRPKLLDSFATFARLTSNSTAGRCSTARRRTLDSVESAPLGVLGHSPMVAGGKVCASQRATHAEEFGRSGPPDATILAV